MEVTFEGYCFAEIFCCFLSSYLWKNNMSGDAIKSDDNVPKITPIVITKAKLKIVEPPNATKAVSANNVVRDVIVVLLKVVLRASLTMSL